MWVDGAGVDVPIIPGIMPIQNYASFRRLTNLTKCPVPAQVASDLDAIKVIPSFSFFMASPDEIKLT